MSFGKCFIIQLYIKRYEVLEKCFIIQLYIKRYEVLESNLERIGRDKPHRFFVERVYFFRLTFIP